MGWSLSVPVGGVVGLLGILLLLLLVVVVVLQEEVHQLLQDVDHQEPVHVWQPAQQ